MGVTTITVTNLDDSGSGSLRQAIADAGTEAGVRIAFADSLKGGTITLEAGSEPAADPPESTTTE